MQYSNTTTKDGLLQDCEFWTSLGDGVITADSTLKARFTALLNIKLAKWLAKVQLLSGQGGAEDTNYGSEQFSTFDIVSGQNSYTFSTDEAGNTISDITGVLLQPSGSADYRPLHRLTLDAYDALLVMSPNVSNTGTPTDYIEKNNTVYFDVLPDYSQNDGGKLFYRLVPSYFTTDDTTKKPGFAEGYERILSIDTSLDWLAVNKSENTVLIGKATAELENLSTDLEDHVRQQNPTRTRITGARHSSR